MQLLTPLLLITLLSFPLSAQKPVNPQPFEFGTVPDTESEYLGKSRVDSQTGQIISIYNPAVSVSGVDPESQARNYLLQHQSLFNIDASEIDNLQLHAIRRSEAGTTVRLRQYYQNLPVNKAEITISITPQQTVGFVMSSLAYNIDLANVEPTISPTTARTIAHNHIGLRSETSEESKELFIYTTKDDSRLAYRIILVAHAPLGQWESIIDAHSGEILKVENVACYYHDHKAANNWHPPFVLNGTGNVFDPDPLSSAEVGYYTTGYRDNNDNNSTQLINEQVSVVLKDITLQGGRYYLKGPWAEIQDFETPNKGLFSQTSPNWNFNRSDDAFEAVNVYYHIDASMRYLNDTLGLDIKPFNYSSGVRVDPSGLGGSDNSHYIGGSQRLAFGEGGVDDAEDSDVIHHELGHGLHDWVTFGGLSQGQGLSEGSGDYWAASYNRSLHYLTNSAQAYNWVFRWDGHNEFWGGRVTNLTGTYPNALSGGIHNQGQFWATSMLKVWDAIGKNKTDKIFWEGLGMTNGSANQNDAANAVYQAANNIGCTNAERLQIHTILTNQGYTLPTFVLPVDWANIEAKKVNRTVVISWSTSEEPNNDFFSIERSIDEGKSFQAIARINSISEAANTYRFVDQQPAHGTNIYRIRQTDVDGTFSFSPLRSITFDSKDQYLITPNPVKDQLSVVLPTDVQSESADVELIDLSGRRWLKTKMSIDLSNQSIRVRTDQLPKGIYILRLQLGNETISERFIKQ